MTTVNTPLLKEVSICYMNASISGSFETPLFFQFGVLVGFSC